MARAEGKTGDVGSPALVDTDLDMRRRRREDLGDRGSAKS
jgi:hypothetical protein